MPTVLKGTVTRFQGDGRKLGYPTANIIAPTDLEDGIYFGYADLADYTHHLALIFIGTPTTLPQNRRRVEAHLLDIPDQDYYDLPLHLSVEHFYRTSQHFTNLTDLKAALATDEAAARAWTSS